MSEFAINLLKEFWATLAEMSPYLLFGFFIAGLLSVLVSQPLVERHLGGRGIWPLIKASVFGVPLPLCSCGVIPVSMSLYKHGAGKGSTISFLLSTPQTGVDSIFVTYSLLGPVFAFFRPLAAFATGIIGGGFVNLFDKSNSEQKRQKCTDECCSPVKKNRIKTGFNFAFITLPRDIGKAMLVGIVIAAFISALVPPDFFAGRLSNPLLQMLVMMLIGIPVYVCATASVPIAAALILKGISPGAALVFLMTGPATNAASFTTIWKTLGSRTAILYLAAVAVCAFGGGLFLDQIAGWFDINVIIKPHWMLPHIVKDICAVVLLGILAFAIFFPNRHIKDNN
ncbi:MAG: permease [Sedimentisphaerales bacterium]|nr:permease [Sedimentisphaerales bacterium]